MTRRDPIRVVVATGCGAERGWAKRHGAVELAADRRGGADRLDRAGASWADKRHSRLVRLFEPRAGRRLVSQPDECHLRLVRAMAELGVNIDHVATIRQARHTDEPDPVWAAVEAQLAGAACITFHLREDRRHINDRDALALKPTVSVKLNMEMSIAPEIVAFAERLQPDQCTLVPERREELTTEGGLDVVRHLEAVTQAVVRLKECGCVTSAFVEPRADQIRASADAGFDAVELWTAGYANADTDARRRTALDQLIEGVGLARQLGMDVHGGHGLTYRNVAAVAGIGGFSEFNIGHSIVSRAVLVGMHRAVAEMAALLRRHAPVEK